MNDDKKIMNVFAQAYQLIAKASKQKPSQEGFQQVLEMLGEDGIQQCAEVVDEGPEVVAQTMVEILQKKSAQKAANGAKLNYLMQLKGKCPSGYLKNGGRCKPCEKAEGVFRNKADFMQNGGNTPSISAYRKQNQKLKEKLNQSDRIRTEGVRDKDGKLRGTERYPRRLPELTVTNKISKKKQEGGSILSKVSTKLPTKLIRDKEYPIYNYDGNIASYGTDDNARELSGHLPYNPSKYTRVEPYDGITTRAFDVAMSNYKNPTFKDRLNVLGQYLKDPKGFKQYHYIDYQKNYQNK